MDYIQYSFTISPPEPGSDILIALLADLGFESFTQNETGVEAYIQEELENENLVKELSFDDFIFSYTRTVIPKTNWNEEWEKSFEPVYVNDLVCIRAHFHPKSEAAKHDIIITPKMSFGTGHHDTTWLVSKTMFSLNFKGSHVLDMGCGTGILAILAKKLGATKISGIDIDDWSIENSIENAGINNAADIEFKKGDASLLPSKETYDIILANINKNVLKKDIPSYFKCLKSGGYLLLSGFFTADVEELKSLALNIGFIFEESYSKNEWAVIKLKK
ncbi:MAG: ribosomal protein methyltransferase [Bacteroidota bacterium]|jgi:ribosomal protein L11 methyltransferase|nr:ribosomal protein methyltransferase [Bacteroidota bacterium]